MVKISILFTAVAAAATFGAVTAAPLLTDAVLQSSIFPPSPPSPPPFPGPLTPPTSPSFSSLEKLLNPRDHVARQGVVGNIQIPSETPFGSIPSKIGKFLGGLLFGKRDVESLTPEEMLILSAMLGDKPVNVARQEVVGNIQVQGESPFGSIFGRIGRFITGLFEKRDVDSLTPEEMIMLSAILGQN